MQTFSVHRPDGRRRSRPARTGALRSALWRAVAPVRVTGQVAGATLRKAWGDRILGLSAEAAFWQLLSLPPLVLAMLAVLGYSAQWTGADLVSSVQSHVLRLTAELVSPTVQQQLVTPTVAELLRHGRGGVATISGIFALWAGSSSTATFVNTVSIAYGQRELRGALASRLLALWLYVCTLATAVVAVPLLLIGPDLVVSWLPDAWQDVAAATIRVLYWPLTAAIVFAALSAFYHYATPARLTWRRAMPGAALALALFLGFSSFLRAYFAEVGERLLVFSTLAAPIAALLYFYVIALSVLLGAELNGTLEARWPAGRRRRRLHALWRWLTGRRRRDDGAAPAEPAVPTGVTDAGPAPDGRPEAPPREDWPEDERGRGLRSLPLVFVRSADADTAEGGRRRRRRRQSPVGSDS